MPASKQLPVAAPDIGELEERYVGEAVRSFVSDLMCVYGMLTGKNAVAYHNQKTNLHMGGALMFVRDVLDAFGTTLPFVLDELVADHHTPGPLIRPSTVDRLGNPGSSVA